MADERVRMLCWGMGILRHREEEPDEGLDAALMDLKGFVGYDDQPVAADGPEARFYFFITEEFRDRARALALEKTAGARVILITVREPVMFEME